MPCFTPLKAYKGPDGKIYFDSKSGYVDRPLELACGQCRGCRAERARQWSLRVMHEAQMHDRNSFITLTYSPEKMPADGGLHVEDFQLFCKRLRKRVGKFRFFHCGEYGDANRRPHYHACVFGVDFSGDRVVFKHAGFNSLYTSSLLDSCWGNGFSTIGALTRESAEYVARYVMKKMTGERGEEEYLRCDEKTGEVWSVRPPYVTMSRRPGVGSSWFDKYKSDVFPADEVVYDGKRFRTPRYYDNKLDEAELEAYKRKRRDAVFKHREDLAPERLKSLEYIAVERDKLFERSL